MGPNSFGSRFVVTTFGESHGPALGVVIDGCPAGVPFDEALLRRALARRRPGTSELVSARAEPDEPEVLSGVYEGRTLGTPIAILVRNRDARPEHYRDLPARGGHADDTWALKFGHRDPRGGGRASGRETVSRVMAGAVAAMLVRVLAPEVTVTAFARAIGPLELTAAELARIRPGAWEVIDRHAGRFPSSRHEEVATLLRSAREEGKSWGGVAEVWVDAPPPGLGQPVFRKLKAELAAAAMSIGATAGVQLGAGFAAARAEGTTFHRSSPPPYGGIRGGISTGERITLRVAFKPTATVLEAARRGRHDPCIVPRAVPVLEAMTWIVLADHLLWRRTDRL